MNNTLLIKEHRLSSMNQLLKYLHGMHEDVGMSGDRGDLTCITKEINVNLLS
jgi:hypothetical protein